LDVIPDFRDLILTVLTLYLRQCLPLVGLSDPEERHGLAIPSYPIPNAVFVTINNPVTRDALFFDTKDEATIVSVFLAALMMQSALLSFAAKS
jgi:hypothetical protein